MTTKTDYPNLLAGLPDWGSLNPERQYELINSDPKFTSALLDGDAEATVIFDRTSQRLVAWREQQHAAELAAATKAHENFVTDPLSPRTDTGPQADLAKLTSDQAWRDRFDQGDLEARRQFAEATEAVAKHTATVSGG
jgi:hypothetical protein